MVNARFLMLTPSSAAAVACIAAGVSYLTLVRVLRWRRYHAIHAKYLNRLEDITPEEAQEIIDTSLHWDMPMLLYYATSFALFKTYGIPTISKLLNATKEIKSLDTISRRYADTEILISTWATCPINGIAKDNVSDPRAMLALARTNWLHSHFNISNDDLVYTMSLFVLEPMGWADKYGWRPLSLLEQHAYYVFWVEIGRRMNMKDIPDSLQELREWARAYEMKNMIPSETNKEVSKATVEELLYAAPKFMKPFGRGLVAAALEDHVREAMMMPKPRWYSYKIVNAVLYIMGFVQKYMMLPRWNPWSPVAFELPEISKGDPVKLHPIHHAAKPWYKAESRGLGYIIDRLSVTLGVYADVPGPHLKSEGYVLQAQGPERFEKLGHEEVIRMAEVLQGRPIPEEWKVNPPCH